MTVSVTGRPAGWSDPEEMAKAIDKYFKNPPKRTIVVGGEPIEVPSLTITGLAIHLGFESRQSFYDYEKKEAFSYIIKRARLFIENEYEARLTQNNVTGAIFALKNMGWRDNVEMTGSASYTVQVVNPHDADSTD